MQLGDAEIAGMFRNLISAGRQAVFASCWAGIPRGDLPYAGVAQVDEGYANYDQRQTKHF
jgi:hypothetical protein